MKQNRNRGAPNRSQVYVEVQIHGPVDLRTDVQYLSVPGKEAEANFQLKKNIARFQCLTNCDVLWQGDLLDG
jgi:hypothetical protein